MAVTSDKKYLISGSHNGILQLLDYETKQLLFTFQDSHEYVPVSLLGRIDAVVVTSDNKFIISGASTGSIRVHNIETKEKVHDFEKAHEEGMISLALTSNDRFIISGSRDKSIKVFDLETKQQVHHFQDAHERGIVSIALTSNDRFVVSASEDKSLEIFDLETEKQVHHFQKAHPFRPSAVMATPDDRFIISCSSKSFKIFDFGTKQQVHHFENVHQKSITSLALTSDSRFLITGSFDSAIKIFDLDTKQQISHFQNVCSKPISSLVVTFDGNHVLCGSKDGSIKVFSLGSMQKTDLDSQNATIPSSKSKSVDLSILNQEFYFVYKGMASLQNFNSVDHFLFDNLVEYSISQAIKYPEIFVLPFRWTILHILSVYEKHDFIEKMPEYSEFKMPFLLDSLNKTPLHYLLAHKNVNSITISIMFRYICDYLDDCYLENPFQFQRTIESMISLLPDIFQRIEIKSRYRFLHIIYAKSPIPYNEPPPIFGNIISEAVVLRDSPVLTQETRDKIWNDQGTTQVEFRSNFLCLDYDILSQDMNSMIDGLKGQEGEEFFKIPAITRLIDYLWGQAATPLMIFFALYSAFVIALSVYLTFDDRSLPYEVTLLVVSVLFTANEFLQMFHLRMSYLGDLWNWLDLSHLFLTIAFLITRIADNDNELARAWISTIIIILGYIRWISLLKIFKPTRNLIQVVITIVKDMVSFIIIIALIIIAFSLIFLVFNREAEYGDYLYGAYNVMYGPLDIEEDAAWPFLQKLIMAVLAFFLNVVLLNLLISIMGDSYGPVLEMRDRTDALTRLEMISEAVIYRKLFKPNKSPNKKRIFGLLFACRIERRRK